MDGDELRRCSKCWTTRPQGWSLIQCFTLKSLITDPKDLTIFCP